MTEEAQEPRATGPGLALFAVAGLMLFAAGGLRADAITLDSYTISMNTTGGIDTAPFTSESASSDQLGNLAVPLGYCAGINCGVEALGLPNTFMFGDASMAPNVDVGVHADLHFYYELVGPASADPIPLIFTGTLSVGTTGQAGAGMSAIAQVESDQCLAGFGCTIASGLANFAECFLSESLTDSCSASATGTLLHFSVFANTEYGIDETIGVSGNGATTKVLMTGFAEIDPIISIDPSFAGAGNYQILLSNGIGNSADVATPEPATFALVGLALGAVAFLRRVKLLQSTSE